MAKSTCKVENCGRPARAYSYCTRHARNFYKTGNPIPRKEWPLEARLRDVGWTVTESGCWEWNGKRRGRTPETSYGCFSAKLLGYVDARAHRVMYECFIGPIPDGLIVRHRCDNPPCVNPEHLIPGTNADNSRDMAERGRQWLQGRERCGRGHDLTLPGATVRYQDSDKCAKCIRERSRESKARVRERLGLPYRPRLTAEQVAEIRLRRAGGEPLKTLAADFNRSVRLISSICTGKAYPGVAMDA